VERLKAEGHHHGKTNMDEFAMALPLRRALSATKNPWTNMRSGGSVAERGLCGRSEAPCA